MHPAFLNEQDRGTFRMVKFCLRIPELTYEQYRIKLFKKEYSEEYRLELKGGISYNFFQENLSWMTKLRHTLTRGMLSPWRNIDEMLSNLNPMDYAILTGDIKFATLYVKYGMSKETFYRSPNRRYVLESNGNMTLNDIQHSMRISHDTNHATVERTEEFLTAKLEIFAFAVHANRRNLLPAFCWIDFFSQRTDLLLQLHLRGGRMLSGNQRGFRRILLIAKFLDGLTNSTTSVHRNFEDHIMCLKLYFRTINDPFICKEEFQEFLSFFYEGMTENTIKSLTGDFETLFQESAMPFAPRSLKHLCRFTLRSIVEKKNLYLPDAVSSFRIPDTLKGYIYGEL